MTWNNTVGASMPTMLCEQPGPFLSVYMDVSRDEDEAAHRLAVRWRSARHDLLRQGAPEPLVDLVGERLLAPTGVAGKAARMIVGSDDAIHVDEVVCKPRAAEVLTWGPLPDVTSWLTDRSMRRPVLVVLADREGADIELYDAWPGRPSTQETTDGDTEHIHKVQVGGWSHKRYLRRSELTWRRNAENVAPEIENLVERGVRLVAMTGDVRAQKEIRDAVSERTRSLMMDVDAGGRATGASRDALDEAIEAAVHDAVDEDHRRVMRELEEEAGRHGAAALGLQDVVPKLVHGQVRTLMLAPATAAERDLIPAEHPGLSLPSGALDEDRVRADLAVLCAAAATDAEPILVPHSLSDDGIAAILRWTDEPADTFT